MRVALDGKALVSPHGGVARYVEGLLAGLSELAPDAPSVELLQPRRPRRTLPWVVWDLQRASSRGFDLLHCPFYYPPLAPRTRTTVAIHDVLFLEHPEWFPEGRRNLLRWLVPPGARRADAVITFSRTSAAAIAAHCRVANERIRVIPHGVDRTRFKPSSAAIRAQVLQRRGLEAPFLLIVGFLEERRGLDLAVRATAAVRRDNPELELLVVGEARSRVAALEAAPDWVRRVGRVTDDELAALFGAADAVLAPSRGEGFDLPVLEALAAGAVVVASDISVHRELFDEAVELFTTGDHSSLARSIQRVRSDCERRSELVSAAARVATRFTWEASARAHVDVWREIAG